MFVKLLFWGPGPDFVLVHLEFGNRLLNVDGGDTFRLETNHPTCCSKQTSCPLKKWYCGSSDLHTGENYANLFSLAVSAKLFYKAIVSQ